MASSCLCSQTSLENASFIASKVLTGNLPELSERSKVYLTRLTDRLYDRENEEMEVDEDSSVEEEVDTEQEGAEEEETEQQEAEEDEDDSESDYDFLFDSRLESGEAPFNLKDYFPQMNNSSKAGSSKRKLCSSRAPSAKKARTSKVTIVSRVTPEKPANNDDNEYRVITLSNGLRAALIRVPSKPENDTNEDFFFFMNTLNEAINERKKKQKCLPLNFPAGFPLANLPVAQAVTTIIEHEMKEHAAEDNRPTDSSLPMLCAGDKTKESLQASIAITVNVGACDDPEDCAGLAHFTEHMVHYGSKKYPGEEEYFSVSLNYGYDFNAFTENHTTTYYNTVPLACVSKFLDRMTDLLAYPIFDEGMALREVNSVDAEFNLSRHYDILRRRHLFGHAVKGHPLGKFDCGNADTLLAPKNIHKTLRDYHSRHYVASAMTVSLESTLPLSIQEKLILKNFSNLLEGNRGIYLETPPTAAERKVVGKGFNMDYVMQGICSFSNLWMAWPIPETFVENKSNKSLSIFLKLLGDERPGSLAHYLTKTKGYIWLMQCSKSHAYSDPFIMESKYATFVAIDYFLTPAGEANVKDIMLATFTYIHELGKLTDAMFLQIFGEMKVQEELHKNAHASATSLAKALQYVGPQDLLKNDGYFWKNAVYNPQEIQAIMRHLTATNMIVIQTLPNKTNLRRYLNNKRILVEPFGETEFVVQGISSRFDKLVSRKQNWSNAEYNFRFLGGNVNMNALLEPCHHCGSIEKQELDLHDTFGTKVFQAIHFGSKPGNYESACIINYINHDAMSTPRHYAMSLLWATSVYFNVMNEFESESLSSAVMLMVHEYGITIGLMGFLSKIQQQIGTINREFFVQPVDKDGLKKSKTALLGVFDLVLAHSAEFIIEELLHFMVCNHSGEVLSDALGHIQGLTLNEVNNFAESFKSKSIALVLFAGNVSIPCAHDVVDTINEQGKVYASYVRPLLTRLGISEYLKPKTCFSYKKNMKTGERWLRVRTDLSYTYTTTVVNFYCVGIYNAAEYQLWWNSLFFFGLQTFLNLRTKKQLGYHVLNYFPKPLEGQPIVIGVGVTSTARKFSPCELDKHLDEWMVEYGEFLKTVDEKKFMNMKKHRGVADSCKNVKMAAARAWYVQYFGDTFASEKPNKFKALGISKIGVQVLGNDSKHCSCEKCNSAVDWARSNTWKHLLFARGNAPFQDFFIDNPRKIRDE